MPWRRNVSLVYIYNKVTTKEASECCGFPRVQSFEVAQASLLIL